ncbi:non-ribosomal peptide synthetase [Herpetosiphon geysericola]|uniref:non-ribosomal peptide synthetase n=1 Tax=Herpetosiphon geysericola TaxID=70996 RepID=UPI0006C8EAAB|nr:non-ribosomal peptide synthetase [Herpetosiphon geysericola]
MTDFAAKIAALPPEKQALLIRRLQQAAKQPPALVTQPRTSALLPLSFAQERQWVLYQWDPTSPLYNITYGVRYVGKLDIDAVQTGFNTIAQRHEVLRTTFKLVDNVPYQQIHAELNPGFNVVDLRDLSDDALETAMQSQLQAETQQPFDLQTGPLLRILVLQIRDNEYIKLINVHHSVFDGWSAGVMIAELNSLLNAAYAGQPSSLPALPIQYADYAVWQRNWLQGSVLEQQLHYWKTQLAGELPILKLPTDRPYPAVESSRGAHYRVQLSPDLVQRLVAWSRSEGYTLNIILLAVWKTLLFRYTNQSDLLVGMPIANRHYNDLQALIGYFVNTLVIRTQATGDMSFRSFLDQVRAANLAAQDHQDLPFEQLVEALQPERNLAHTPIFQSLFVFQRDTVNTFQTPELAVEPLPIETGTAKFALSLEAISLDQQINLSFEYKTDLFEPATIERLAQHYQILLEAALTTPELELSRLPLLSKTELQQLLPQAKPSLQPNLLPLHERFEQQAQANPQAIAVRFEQSQLSYAELNSRANQLAHQLKTLNVGPDSLVGLCVEPSLDTIIGILAILKAGGAYLPIDPSYPQERIVWLLADANVGLVMTQTRWSNKLPQAGLQLIMLDAADAELSTQPTTNLPASAQLDNLAYVIYTSGSTGTPKGALITHRNVARLFSSTEHWFGFNQHDVWSLFHSFAFDFSVWEIWGALLYGGRLVVVPFMTTRNPAAFYQLLCDEGVTVLNQTPSAFRQLIISDAEHALPSRLDLRYVIFGGEALNVGALQPWFERHGDVRPQLVNMYGITETTVHVTYRPLTLHDAQNPQTSPIGAPIPDLDLYVLDDHYQPVPFGIAGELYVGGAGLARGYWNRPELTNERFIQHPFAATGRLYKTGDLVRRLANNEIEYLGRRDNQVKIRGFRIELGEIQAMLMAHPAITDAIVTVNTIAADDQRLVAYLVTLPNQAPRFSQLRSFLKQRLPEYMVPSSFIMLDAIPLTANGKIDYRALPSQQQAKPVERSLPLATPTSVTEQSLLAIWTSLLGVAQIGIQDNFFDLGGHSLLATQVISRIREVFNVSLNLRDFFLSPTIKGLASIIEQANQTPSQSSIIAIHKADPQARLPLSYAQQRIWFLAQMDPNSSFYTVPVVLEINGRLNLEALERTLNELVERHHSLRTRFVSHEGQTIQQVQPAQPLELAIDDLSGLAGEAQATALEQRLQQEVNQPFQLDRDQLMRGRLLKLAEQQHVLALSIHHIAFDDWSQGILFSEMTQLYQAFANNQAAPLPELALQYPDFAAWQRYWLQGEVLQAQLDFWKQQLHGKLPLLEMPLDYPRPSIQTFNGAHETLSIEPELYRQLNQLARDNEATMFMLLMTAWVVLLNRYTNQSDIVVGTPVANRNRQELENIIGFFANTLAIRTDLSDEPSLQTVLQRIRETALNAYSHQDLPFDLLVSEILPERQTNRSPIFQAMLVLQNASRTSLDLPEVQIVPRSVETKSAKFELSLVLYDHGSSIDAWLEYNTDLFKAATIKRMTEQFLQLLANMVANPQQKISEVSLLSTAEKERLLGGWVQANDDDYDLF